MQHANDWGADDDEESEAQPLAAAVERAGAGDLQRALRACHWRLQLQSRAATKQTEATPTGVSSIWDTKSDG